MRVTDVTDVTDRNNYVVNPLPQRERFQQNCSLELKSFGERDWLGRSRWRPAGESSLCDYNST